MSTSKIENQNELILYLKTYFSVHDAEARTLADLFIEEEVDKEEYFAQAGMSCYKLSFIQCGYLRIFANLDGKEVTQWISGQGDFVCDLSSLMFKTAARWNIQALEPCKLYSIKGDTYDKLPELLPRWSQLEKLFLSKCFLTLEDRVFSFLSMTAEERFNYLFNYRPALFNEVPLHYLASMLGMTPETLSRIRRKIIS